MPETRESETCWTPNARGPFRVLAGIAAVLGVLAVVGFLVGSFASSLELVIVFAILIPFTVFMALIAVRGTVSVRIAKTTETSTDA